MSCSRYVLLCLCFYIDACYDAYGGFGVSLLVIWVRIIEDVGAVMTFI